MVIFSAVEHYEPFVQELIVSGVTWSDCITIATIENNKIELPHALTMTLQGSTQHLNLTPNSITVIITDDDGKHAVYYIVRVRIFCDICRCS